jgi:hypothetical protein
MSLRDMTIPQMIRITERWLSTDRDILEKTPELSGNIRMLQRVHSGIMAPIAPPENDELKRLQAEQVSADNIFDQKVRGLIMCFAAFAELVVDTHRADRFLQLSRELLPLQLSTVNQTYEEEAGTAISIEAKLNSESKMELSAITIFDGRTLFDEVQDLISSGKRLGVLEDEKKKRQAQAQAPSYDAQRRDARLLWIRTVNVFLDTVDIAEITREERETLRGPILRAEEVVARRKKGEEIKDEESSTPTTGSEDKAISEGQSAGSLDDSGV